MKKNLFSIGIVNLINGIAGIAFIPLAMKSLGAEGYGVYSIFIILTSYIYFVEMGVAKYFTRSIAQSNEIEEQKKNMQSAVGMYIRIALLLIIITPLLVLVITKYIFPTNNSLLMGIIVVLATFDYLLTIPTTVKLTYSTGREKFLNVSRFNLFSGLSKHFVLIATVLLSNSVIILILIMLIRRIIDIIYAKRFLVKLPEGSYRPVYKKGEFKMILSKSLALSAAQLTQVTIISIGTFLVNREFSIKEVGIYKSIFDLASKVWFLSNSIGLVIFPRLAALLIKEEDRNRLMNRIPFFYNISWFSYSMLFLIIVIILPFLPNLLNIQDYRLFILLLLGTCMNAHSNLSYEFLQADSRMKEVIYSSIFVIFTIVFMFYMLLEEYNLYSIGISWVLSQFLGSLIMDILSLNSIKRKKLIFTITLNIFITVCVLLVYGKITL